MLTDIDIKKELLKAIVRVARYREFYGHIVQQFEKRFVVPPHPISTAAVGRVPGERFIKLYFNEIYFEKIYTEYLQKAKSPESKKQYMEKARDITAGAVEHEILHVVLHHLDIKFDDKERGGIALDLVVNQLIPSERIHPNWYLPERFGFPYHQTSKWYYDNLKDNKQYQDEKNKSDGSSEGMGDNHVLWDDIQDDSLSESFIRDIVRKAVENTSSKGWDEVQGEIKESIEDMLKVKKPKIPWVKVFRNFCASATENVLDYTMSRESRRFGTRPGTRKMDVLRVVVIVDTSGSISTSQLDIFFNEVMWIWRNGAQVTIMEADADVKRCYPFNGKFKGEVWGRGGTDLAPALEAAEKGKYDLAIYFTDFCAPKLPRRYKVPVLWVINEFPPKENWPCDWGCVVEITS
jgi:predicted metal-dependent peptidase